MGIALLMADTLPVAMTSMIAPGPAPADPPIG